MDSITLPYADGSLRHYTTSPPTVFTLPAEALQQRVAFSAAHVVCDPLFACTTAQSASLDWDATLAYRRFLWSHGLAVAEAMDTAQRGMGLDWKTCQQLISRSVAEAHAQQGKIACGAGTDHLAPAKVHNLESVIAAYEEQCSFVEQQGSQIILMASRALAASATSAEDYLHVYERILQQVSQPVILHWLGEMFDPALHAYWGSTDVDLAMDTCLALIERNVTKVDGIKISLLDAQSEITLRRRLPAGVRLYTGDDFNYVDLIQGDEQGYSHALLGIFDAIAPAASAALYALDQGDLAGYRRLLEPTLPLARHIFQAPTAFYKTGIVFLAYLNGHQSHFRMVAGLESARSLVHLSELFMLADQAGLLSDPALAVQRMRRVLVLSGIV